MQPGRVELLGGQPNPCKLLRHPLPLSPSLQVQHSLGSRRVLESVPRSHLGQQKPRRVRLMTWLERPAAFMHDRYD